MKFKQLKLKPGMRVFVGCKVGERRSSIHKKAMEMLKAPMLRVKEGLLGCEDDGKYIAFFLTEMGKAHVAPQENIYAQM
jgi:hypothetical protein